MVNFWKLKTNKISKPSRLNPWSVSLNKPAKAFYGDSDGDKVMNMFDCQPHNKKKQGDEHKRYKVVQENAAGDRREWKGLSRQRASELHSFKLENEEWPKHIPTTLSIEEDEY